MAVFPSCTRRPRAHPAMFHVVLVSPEIPPNTGNAIRLCANTGAQLHLVRPLGFELDDARLRRAGLDYHEWQPVQVHDTLPQALAATGAAAPRIFALTTRARTSLADMAFQAGDVFVFGGKPPGCPRRTWRCSDQPSNCGCPCGRASAASICPTRWR